MPQPTPQRFGALPVPYTAAWSEEQEGRIPTMVRWRCGARILPFVSDTLNRPGRGKPLFKILHADRRREVMDADICQMCVRPLPVERIYVTNGQQLQGLPLVSDGLPMHPECAWAAYEACPGMQRGEAAGRLRIYLARRDGAVMAPKVLGIAHGPGSDERTNALILRHGKLYSGPDLQLRQFRRLMLSDIRLESRKSTQTGA